MNANTESADPPEEFCPVAPEGGLAAIFSVNITVRHGTVYRFRTWGTMPHHEDLLENTRQYFMNLLRDFVMITVMGKVRSDLAALRQSCEKKHLKTETNENM